MDDESGESMELMEVSSRVGGGGERGVVDFGKLFTETNEQKFSLGGVQS